MIDAIPHCQGQIEEHTGGEVVGRFKRDGREYTRVEIRGKADEEGCAQRVVFELAVDRECVVTYVDEMANGYSCVGIH